MGRLRIDDDIVRHLTTFQRLGETLEVESPGEMLPIGARTVFRALRTRAASQLGPDWVWPHWLEQQIDPHSPAFVPRGHLPFLTNITARNWTMVGNVASPYEAIVDQRGLVTTWFDGWSLDWWIGAEDRWHLPSRELPSRVRQSLLDGTPVVETRMRVPGGEVIHRAYAIQAEDELAIVEIENASRVPVALALAVRPYNPEGLAVIERIGLHDKTTVTVDGRVALLLPKPPAHIAVSTFRLGDSAGTVLRGEAGSTFPADLRDEAGMAQAAFVFPLTHGTSFRAALPLVASRRTRRRRLTRRRVERAPDYPKVLPTAAQVANGWAAQLRRGMRFELPDARLQEAVEANRAAMLLFHDGDEITPGPTTYHRFWFRDAAFMLAALDRYGFHQESAEVLASFPRRQRVDGFFLSQPREWDANGCALWAIAEHWRLTRDQDLIEGMVGPIAKGAHWIDRKRRSKRRNRDPEVRGLLPPGVSAEHLGPFDHFYWDDFWGVAGQRAAAELLAAAEQPEAAADAARFGRELLLDLEASMAIVARRLGTLAIPAGPRRRIDAGVIGSLVACEPLHLFPADDPRIAATVDVVRERFCDGPAFFQSISHTGLGTYLTMQLALVELAAGDRRALERLDWMLHAATPTWTWPEAIHPRLGGGCMGDGHHGWAAADFLSFVRGMLVREAGERQLALCTLVPDSWLGQGLEVHDAPTHFGRLSYAVRWHGARPALLWELEAHPGLAGPVTLTAPGLDASWSTTEPKGEALLAPVEPPGGLPKVYGNRSVERGDAAPEIGESFG
jgi:hypothetical protein